MVQLFDYTYMYCHGLTLNKFTYSDKIDQFRQNWFIWTDWIVIHRNHSFGFSFAETNWVSVSTETRFEFRSTETLTETHILGNFSLFENFRNLFLELWIQFYSKITEKYRKVFGHLLLFNVQDDKYDIWYENLPKYGFRSGFRFWFRFRRNFWVSVSVSTETKKVVSLDH